MRSLTHSLTHSVIHSLTPSFFRSFVHSFTYSFCFWTYMRTWIHTDIHVSIHACIRPYRYTDGKIYCVSMSCDGYKAMQYTSIGSSRSSVACHLVGWQLLLKLRGAMRHEKCTKQMYKHLANPSGYMWNVHPSVCLPACQPPCFPQHAN